MLRRGARLLLAGAVLWMMAWLGGCAGRWSVMMGELGVPAGGALGLVRPAPGQGYSPLRVDLADSPPEVRAAAEALKGSRVGYALSRPEATYLIIATGSERLKVAPDRIDVQVSPGAAPFIDVRLRKADSGASLLVLKLPAGEQAEFQFDLDEEVAAIPTLQNSHSLPLTPLAGRFVLLAPRRGEEVAPPVLQVAGYARVFEGRFSARVIAEDGRVLGSAEVAAAAGAPSWGSFVAAIPLGPSDLPAAGYLLLSEGMTEARLKVPLRFRPAGSGQ